MEIGRDPNGTGSPRRFELARRCWRRLRRVSRRIAPSAPADPAQPGVAEPAKQPERKLQTRQLQRSQGDRARERTREALCLMVESAARAANLPLEFFARVIWQESRFQSDAVGPVTRAASARRHCAVHAGNRERAAAARSLRSRAGTAEIRRVPQRVARPVRQSRPRGGGL